MPNKSWCILLKYKTLNTISIYEIIIKDKKDLNSHYLMLNIPFKLDMLDSNI